MRCVRFGMRVTLRPVTGTTRASRLVGEDEATPRREAGESVLFQGVEAETVSIEP